MAGQEEESFPRNNIVVLEGKEYNDFPNFQVDNAFIHYTKKQQIGIIKKLGEIMLKQKCENSVECGVGGKSLYRKDMLGYFLKDITTSTQNKKVSLEDFNLGEILKKVKPGGLPAGEAFFL